MGAPLTELVAEATASLQKEVERELQIPDPECTVGNLKELTEQDA